jgi:hypothetical protein
MRKTKTKFKTIGGNVVAGLLFSALLSVTMLGIYALLQEELKSQESSNWTAVDGTIISSQIDLCGKYKTSYFGMINYKYIVNGMGYIGSRISFGQSCGSKNDADHALTSYPVGSSIKVYFDPRLPTDAVLLPGIAKDLGTIGFLAFLFFVFICLAYCSWIAFGEAIALRRAAVRGQGIP